MLPTPLQVLLFSSASCETSATYNETLTNCFQGGGTGYLSGASDTGVPVREFHTVPSETPDDVIGDAFHTLAIVLLSKPLADDRSMVDWLRNFRGKIDQEANRLVIFDLNLLAREFSLPSLDIGPVDVTDVASFGEYAVRRTYAGLFALHHSVQLLAVGSSQIEPKVRFFVSHAKLDGQSLATVLSAQIKSMPDFEAFYDADDLDQEADWRAALKNGVQSCVLIVLRTGKFEARPWCIQEMQWAEEFSSPLIVVDLRHELITPPSLLSFERSQTVRISDGNLYRVIFIAMREALCSRLHTRVCEALAAQNIVKNEQMQILVRQPGMSSLARIGKMVSSVKQTASIIYPDPPLHEADRIAAEALLESIAPGSRLTTPQTLCLET